MIRVMIHAWVHDHAVTSDGRLRPSEKGVVEIMLPEVILRAHTLPSAAPERGGKGYLSALVEVSKQGEDFNGTQVVEVPYRGWRVDVDSTDDTASVLDDRRRPRVTYHAVDPAGRTPEQQATDHLAALRRGA